jgi:putative hydrolase of the HAD superfamily
MNAMIWQAIVFDLDDTLYPEHDYVLSGFRAVAEWASEEFDINQDNGFQELHNLFDEGIQGNTFNIWLENHGLSDTYVEHCIRVYRSHQPNLTPYPDVLETLNDLKSSYKFGLISDGYLHVQEKKWASLGLDSYFNTVTFSDKWGRQNWKPSTTPYIHTQQMLETEYMVYVADNLSKDFFGARQCNWGTVHIQRGDGQYKDKIAPSIEYEPDAVISTLRELRNTLSTLL